MVKRYVGGLLTSVFRNINADNSAGIFTLTNVAQYNQAGVWAGPPRAPTGVTAVASASSATVSFTAPTNTGGSPITSYTVTASPGNITASGSSSPITVSGLTNGVSYTFTVTATNALGAGPAGSGRYCSPAR